MDPFESPSHPNAPGPPLSSRGGFQFKSSPFAQNAAGSVFGQDAASFTFGQNAVVSVSGQNTVGSTLGQNTAGSIYAQNSTSAMFGINAAGSTFGQNTAGSTFGQNTAGSTFGQNTAGPTFGQNTAGPTFWQNTAGSVSGENTGGSLFGQNTAGSTFGQNLFGNRSVVPPNESGLSNPFAPNKSSASIFGGQTEELSGSPNITPGAVQPSMFAGRDPIGSQAMSIITQTTTIVNSETPAEKAIGNPPSEIQLTTPANRRESSKRPGLNVSAKNRIRSILSTNRQEDKDEDLKSEEIEESHHQKLAAHKLEKKRKSADNTDRSPGKITREDKALYFTLPNENLNKSTIKEHFSTFGELYRVYFNPTKNHCIVHFAKHEDAVKAFSSGSSINGCEVRLFWRNVLRSKKKSESVKEANADGKKLSIKKRLPVIDPEVQEELAAMGGLEKYKPLSLPSGKTSTSTTESGRVLKRTSRKEAPKLSKRETQRTEVVSKEPEQQSEKNNDGGTTDVFIEATAGAQELIAIMKTSAATLEDRLRILEARDKLIRLGQVKQCDLAHAKKTVGSCPDMCPEKERLLRETRRQVSCYEIDESSKPSRMNPALAVKQYARSSADQEEPLPHELRPLAVMTMTMSYLLHCIADLCDRPGENLAEWYHFLWDRTRSIRKEITQLELCDLESVQLVEQCARFHIHCCARLVAEDVSVFDHRINTENLTKCLQTLKHMYYDLWMKHNQTCPNESEFMSYFILLNLNNGSVMWELEQLREDVLQTREIDLAAKMYMAINSNNFVRFFRLVRSASYLMSCLTIRYFYQVRTSALRTHIKALNARANTVAYPLATLSRELAFEDFTQGEQFCAHHGLSVDHSQPDTPHVLFSRNTFRIATTVFAASRSSSLVENKRNGSVGQVIAGGALPARSFEKHVPHDSFDADGYLKQSAWQAVDQGLMPGDLSFEDSVGAVGENDSSAAASDIDDVIHSAHHSETDYKRTIIELAEERAQPSNAPSPQKSTVLPDIVQIETNTETRLQPSSSSFETTGTLSFSQPSQSRSIFSTTSTLTSQQTTMKTIFGTPSTSTAKFGTSSSAANLTTVTQNRDVKPTSPIKNPLFSKTSSSTGTNLPPFGGLSATSGIGGAGRATLTPSFGKATTSSIFGGASTTSSSGVTTAIFGGTTTTSASGGVTPVAITPRAIRGSATTNSLSGVSSSSAFAVKPSSIFGGNAAVASPSQISSFGGEVVTVSTASFAESSASKKLEEEKKIQEAEAAAVKEKAEAQKTEEKVRRARLLENHLSRKAEESFNQFIILELRQAAEETLKSAKEAARKEKELREKRAVELSETLMTEVLLEELEELAAEVLNIALEERERAVQNLTAKYFIRWLEKTRLSLSRKRAIENFPAGVTHLSLKEHANRWGYPSLDHIKDFVKRDEFHVRGIPKLSHSWTSLSSLVGKEVVLRYHDRCRQLRWKHSSEVTFKVFFSVNSDSNDPSTRLTEWFVRNPQQLKHGSAFEDSRLGVIQYVTTYQVAPDQIVHSSLQLVRGYTTLQNNPELVSGTSAILFSMTSSENVQYCRDRLEIILESLADLPPPPLVVVVFGEETALEATSLKTLVLNLGLFMKLRTGSICDYKVLYLKKALDMQAVDCELRKVLSYTAQNWSPPQQFSVKPLRTVLIGAFDMFFLSLRCSMDRGQSKLKLINDPQILVELCNEFLKHICAVLMRSRRESATLCAPEVWPNIFKGAYHRFHDHPSYERHVASLLSRMQICKLGKWPPSDHHEFKTWLRHAEAVVSQSSEMIDRWSRVSPWPQVLEDIPWIEVFKACMERKFQEVDMSELCGTELYVIVGSKRLEKLHNDPWWKHSRRLHLYLSKFEKHADDTSMVDSTERKNPNESDPPFKRRCVEDELLDRSVPDIDDISLMIDDHQLSLRSHTENDSMDKTDERKPTMSKLEMFIDSLESRLGLGPHSSPKMDREPEKIEAPKRSVSVSHEVSQEVSQPEVVPEGTIETVQQEEKPSRDDVKGRMKSILEAARNIVAPLQLTPASTKRRELVRDYLLGRGKGDSDALKIPLSVLCHSSFIERSQKEVEKRINLHKRCASPESDTSSFDDASQSDSALGRRSRKRTSSDRSRSSLSDKSPSSVEAHSVNSDEEQSDYNSDNHGEESPEYDDESVEYDGRGNRAETVEVIRSSSEEREGFDKEEEDFYRDENEEEEYFEGEEFSDREFSEVNITREDYVGVRLVGELSEDKGEGEEEEEEEEEDVEEGGYGGEEEGEENDEDDRYDDGDCSVHEISSDE